MAPGSRLFGEAVLHVFGVELLQNTLDLLGRLDGEVINALLICHHQSLRVKHVRLIIVLHDDIGDVVINRIGIRAVSFDIVLRLGQAALVFEDLV